MKAHLEILSGDRSGEKVSLSTHKTYILGREAAVDIPLPEKKISRRHASLTVSDAGIIIEDLQSLNGTFVNGNLIEGPTELQDRDRFQIGSHLFELVSSDKKSPEDYLTDSYVDSGPKETDPGLLLTPYVFEEEHSTSHGASISGKLSEVMLSDLLQMLASTKKTGRLVIAEKKKDLSPNPPKGTPSLYIEKGNLIGAEINELQNEEAFYEILRLNNYFFSLFPTTPVGWPSGINLPIEALLLEGLRRLDEEKTAHFKFTPEIMFEVSPDEPLTKLNPDELRIFQIVWKKKNLEGIWASSHLDQAATDAILRKLLKGTYIRKV